MNSGHEKKAQGEEGEMKTQGMLAIRKNFIQNQLCCQINSLQTVLTAIVEEGSSNRNGETSGSITDAIKKIEVRLRQIRKLCTCS